MVQGARSDSSLHACFGATVITHVLKTTRRGTSMHKIGLLVLTLAIAIAISSCKGNQPATPTSNTATPTTSAPKAAGPLPDAGFKAALTLADPPAKLRAGQVETINLKVKNASSVMWWARGGETTTRTDNMFYIAAGNRWLDKDGKLTTETEGHSGIPRDLKPGEEIEMPLQITAPKTPGDWTLSLDMVQEGVTWFGDKGSPTTKIKIAVVK
jgi:hypothetical protein